MKKKSCEVDVSVYVASGKKGVGYLQSAGSPRGMAVVFSCCPTAKGTWATQ